MLFKRPVDEKFPISAGYGKWGIHWSFYMDRTGKWLKGQVDGKGQHKGIDFAVPVGTMVHAMADGLIVSSGWENRDDPKQGFGLRVRQQIVTENGHIMTLVYGHLSTAYPLPGHQIVCGDRIGFSGQTGHATGPHLHVEMIDLLGQYRPIEFYTDSKTV